MGSVQHWLKAGLLGGSALTVAACSTYPAEPRFPVYPVDTGRQAVPYAQSPYAQRPAQQATAPQTSPYAPPARTAPVVEQGPIADSGSIEGGGLAPVSGSILPPGNPGTSPYAPPTQNTAPTAAPVMAEAGATYIIQPGDTLNGVGRRFQTPVQTLIDMNGLGPRGSINVGQNIRLPVSAVDRGHDQYATGPSPVGVPVPAAGVTSPPVPPASNVPLPAATAPAPAQNAAPTAPAASLSSPSVSMQWPVRGDILRRFGPMGMGERNNGISIGARAGSEVKASADGTVAYVGDDIVGQGLTVLIVHRDGWRSVYSHLGSATVRDGAQVRAGQAIGTVGLTAGDGRPSLHFEVRQMRGDDPVAIDPLSVLPR